MNEPAGFDPYRPPAAVETTPQAGPAGFHQSAALTDTRLVGNVAMVCISIQVLIKFAMVPGVTSFEWLFVVTIAHLVAFLASIITFLVWLYRVASNVRRINPHAHISPGWAVGSYFVPFANWVVPIISMRDIVRNSFVRAKPGALGTVAVVWWLSFVFSGIAQRFVRVDPVMMGIWLLTITVSWICALVLISRISRVQASFRWSDLPQSRRPMMVPLGSSRANRLPGTRIPGKSETGIRPVNEPDIESEWGRR